MKMLRVSCCFSWFSISVNWIWNQFSFYKQKQTPRNASREKEDLTTQNLIDFNTKITDYKERKKEKQEYVSGSKTTKLSKCW